MRESLSVLPLSNIHTENFFMRILKSSIQKLFFITLFLVILFVSLWFPQQSEAQSVVISFPFSQVQCNTTGTVSAQSKFRRHDKRHFKGIIKDIKEQAWITDRLSLQHPLQIHAQQHEFLQVPNR